MKLIKLRDPLVMSRRSKGFGHATSFHCLDFADMIAAANLDIVVVFSQGTSTSDQTSPWMSCHVIVFGNNFMCVTSASN
jgi:hypothetical protein